MVGQGEAGPEACIFASDPDLRRDVQIYLKRSCGFSVVARGDASAFDPLCPDPPRLIVVSALPEPEDGLALIRLIRAAGIDSFILYVDCQNTPDEGGDAFGAGADDVIRAPFTMREFGLRLRARLGGACAEMDENGTSVIPQVILDQQNLLHAAGMGEAVQLTRAEAEVMAVLIRSGGEIVSRNDLAQAIDRTDWQYGDRRFDVHVANIRKKLRKAFGKRYELRSIRARGYAFREGAAGDSTAERIAPPPPQDTPR